MKARIQIDHLSSLPCKCILSIVIINVTYDCISSFSCIDDNAHFKVSNLVIYILAGLGRDLQLGFLMLILGSNVILK